MAPDLNFIPAALVDHVEVLTGGASAVYGSDAIAGVVNFIMRKDFEGVEIDGQYSINTTGNTNSTHGFTLASLQAAIGTPPAPADWWGGSNADATVIFGVNTDNGKGNITAYLGYKNTKPVAGKERDFSNCTLGTNFVNKLNCQGSSNLNRWISFDNLFGGRPSLIGTISKPAPAPRVRATSCPTPARSIRSSTSARRRPAAAEHPLYCGIRRTL